MNKLILIILAVTAINTAFAQNSFRATIKDQDSGELIYGASVYFPKLGLGGISDTTGVVVINSVPQGTHQLKISFVSYASREMQLTFPLPDSVSNRVIYLVPDLEELEEVVITSTRSTRTIEDIPTRVELIAGEELSEKGNMKPGDIRMLLNESTGIQTQQTSATSYNSSIRIQGLDGKYTQLLRDGMPLYSGFSGGLSLMQIAPLDLRQVEVIKGASSTLYGGGAIAGIVNLISKKPSDEPELNMMLNGTSALGLDASVFYSQKYGKIGTTVFASYNLGSPYDPADIGLTAIPEFDRFTLNPTVFFDLSERTEFYLGLNYITEDRLGGNIDFIEGDEVNDPFFERNDTDRISTQFRALHRINGNSRLEVKNSVSFYDRAIEIPDYFFGGEQISSFSEINLSASGQRTDWVGGVNLWTENFRQLANTADRDLGFDNSTIGAFAQNTWYIDPVWSLETGLRIDRHSDYGFFTLPRFSLMMKPKDDLTMRLGGGMGYKTPTVFSEEAERRQFRNIAPINPDSLNAERSYGANFDVNYRWMIGSELAFSTNTLLFYTRISDPLFLNPAGSLFQFEQFDGFIDTRGMEFNMKASYKDLKLFIGYTFTDVNRRQGDEAREMPLVARHRLNNVLMYEKEEKFWIGLEAYYFSPQQLSDGSVGQSYWIAGLMTEKHFGERVSLFLNFENFLDARQTAFDTIFTGTLSDPQFRDIYAPVDGFVINGGIKMKFL